MSGLSRKDIARVKHALQSELAIRPPSIGVIGVSGTGKSSTINAMFKTSLEISHTRACTTEFLATKMALKMQSGVATDEPVGLIVVDAPGLGEDIRKDPEYLESYKATLPHCDVALWVLSARNRAMSLDQRYLHELLESGSKIVFGINQADLVHPMNWNEQIGLPSEEMEGNFAEIVADRAAKIEPILGRQPIMIAYSAERGYNLEQLFASLIDAIPEQRRFIYDGLKNFSYRDFIPANVREKGRNLK